LVAVQLKTLGGKLPQVNKEAGYSPPENPGLETLASIADGSAALDSLLTSRGSGWACATQIYFLFSHLARNSRGAVCVNCSAIQLEWSLIHRRDAEKRDALTLASPRTLRLCGASSYSLKAAPRKH